VIESSGDRTHPFTKSPHHQITRFLGPRPPAFLYAGTPPVLRCERLPLTRLAERLGTPLFVYSESALRQRFRIFDRAFARIPHTICYSVKANSNLSILRLLARLGAGFDVVSGGELARVLRVSRRLASKVVFSGVGKTAEEMRMALGAGILLFNVESESELRQLSREAARCQKTARIALRVNPDVPAETHPYISTGLRQHKFGIPVAEAIRLYGFAARQPYLQVAGVSVHIGSQITALEPFADSSQRLGQLLAELEALSLHIRYVDAGGGLGIPYQPDEMSTNADFQRTVRAYAAAIMQPWERPARGTAAAQAATAGLGRHLLLEPGRALVGPAGALLTRVLYRKTNGNKRFLVVDAAMNDLIRPALYGAYHEMAPVTPHHGQEEVCDVVGPVCETGDFLARDRRLPKLTEGELIAILDAGAYAMSLASNYNSRPRPAEVLVRGSSARIVRRRESVSDLWRQEK